MYKAGFDYSWQEASFALSDAAGSILLEEHQEFPPRNASGLPGWLEGILAKKGLNLNDISEWSVGSGPGSFTGLRVAAAFVLGLSFRRDVRKRGVSTAGAMADSLNLPESVTRVLVLFDGRRDELLGFGLERRNGTFAPSGFHEVLNAETLAPLAEYDVLIALDKDAARVQEIAGRMAEGKLRTVPHVMASRLIFNQPDDFSVPLTAPVYLRPAVFVEPRIPRSL